MKNLPIEEIEFSFLFPSLFERKSRKEESGEGEKEGELLHCASTLR